MKRVLWGVTIILLVGASVLSAQEHPAASDAEKIERTKAILAENTSATAAVHRSDSGQAGAALRERTPAPWKTDMEQGFGGVGVSMFKSLAFCLGILLVGLAVYKKFNRRSEAGAGKRIRILERTPLTHRSLLVLLEVDGRRIIASTGQDSVSFLDMDGAGREENVFEQSLKEVCVKER